jgi:hypothetical protein
MSGCVPPHPLYACMVSIGTTSAFPGKRLPGYNGDGRTWVCLTTGWLTLELGGGGQRFLSSAKHPDRLWEPTYHLSLDIGVCFLGDRRPGREYGHSHLEPRLKMHTSFMARYLVTHRRLSFRVYHAVTVICLSRSNPIV